MLLMKPYDVKIQGMSSLHWGCCKGHLDAVKFLVEHKAYPNQMSFSEDRYSCNYMFRRSGIHCFQIVMAMCIKGRHC